MGFSFTNDLFLGTPMAMETHAWLVREARAVLAWFDEYREKAAEYPAMNWVGVEPQGARSRGVDQPQSPNLIPMIHRMLQMNANDGGHFGVVCDMVFFFFSKKIRQQ